MRGLVTDERVGELLVTVDRSGGLVAVEGARDTGGVEVPRVELRREGPALDRSCRAGSRDARQLTLTVAGAAAAAVEPGPGVLGRRSYRVDAVADGVRYRLVPDGRHGSAWWRDGTRLGRLFLDRDGGVSASWADGSEVGARDAALGYLLAAAYGTGGRHPLVTLFDLAFALAPV